MSEQEVISKIEELKREIMSEAGGSPGHIDAFLIIDLAREMDDLQDALWEMES